MTGRPLPRFSDDDVVDFCVAEAIGEHGLATRAKAQAKADKAAKADAWKKDTSALPSG